MAKRDILDYFNNKIGELEMPDDTTEEQWQLALSAYKIPPISIEKIVENKILKAQEFGKQIILEFSKENVLMGLTTQQIANIYLKVKDIQSLLESGSLYVALSKMDEIEPDELLTSERIQKYRNKILNYLMNQ